MAFLTYYYNRFTNLRSKANSKPIFILSVLNALGVAYLASWHLAFHAWIALGENEKLNPYVWEISVYFPILFFSIISIFLLDRITLCFIQFNILAQKLIFEIISKFELIYWRKHRRSSPLINTIFKLQQRFQNIDDISRRRILIVGIIVGVIYFIFRQDLFFTREFF